MPFERVRPLIGMGGDRILPELVPGVDGGHRGKTIVEAPLAIFKERELAGIPPIRGARELLEAVRKRGARVVVATSAKSASSTAARARRPGRRWSTSRRPATTRKSSKPAPDIVSAALKKAGVAPAEAVMVGDTQYDIEAAHEAGVKCVALRCGGNDPATLHEADAIYADPAELIGGLDRPPFEWAIAVGQTRYEAPPEPIGAPPRPPRVLEGRVDRAVEVFHQERLGEERVPAVRDGGHAQADPHQRRAVRPCQELVGRHAEPVRVDQRDVEAASSSARSRSSPLRATVTAKPSSRSACATYERASPSASSSASGAARSCAARARRDGHAERRALAFDRVDVDRAAVQARRSYLAEVEPEARAADPRARALGDARGVGCLGMRCAVRR